MLIFLILSIAAMTRFDFSGSLSCSISLKTVGTTCHDTLNRSLSHPHCTSWPPADRFFQKWSTSSCVSQFTTSDIASVNLKCGPPFNAVNCCPSSSNATVMTDPFGRPEALAPRVVVAGDAGDPGILEDRDVERRRLLGLMIEPQKRRDSLQRLWHRVLPCTTLSDRRHGAAVDHVFTPVN